MNTLRELLAAFRSLPDTFSVSVDEWAHAHRERHGMRPDPRVEYRRAQRAKLREMQATRDEFTTQA